MAAGFGGADAAPKDPDKSQIIILPVPYDGTSTWVKGADKGPFCLIEASSELETYDMETGTDVSEHGIVTAEPLELPDDPAEMVEAVKRAVLDHIDAHRFSVLLGGEHSVSIGSIWAHASRFFNMSVLQLDAHADLRDEYRGSRYNHACTMARAREVSPCVQAGIRSISREELTRVEEGRFFTARDIHGTKKWEQNVLEDLTENVYVTIDLDVLDPSIMPSTGTPQPGGLDWYQITGLLKEVAATKNVVGFDVVELCPNGANKAPDLLAAKLVYKFLSYIYRGRGQEK
jgi:agmatinase